jgi:4-hydroxy-2-oxoheptanedioate aldolase
MANQAGAAYTGLRKILNGPDAVYGASLTIPDPGLAAILGCSGFDFVFLDGEHGPFTNASVRGCVDALASTPAMALMRVRTNDPTLIAAALDLGVDGIVVPKLSSAAAADAAVEASRYAPHGSRGVGTGHATRYGARFREYLAEANEKVAVVGIVESRAGVEAAEQIAAVEGLDAILIGQADLSADLGLLDQPGDERVAAEVARVAAAAGANGVKVGTACDPEEVGELGRAGMGLFICYFDGGAIARGAGDVAARARQAWQER